MATATEWENSWYVHILLTSTYIVLVGNMPCQQGSVSDSAGTTKKPRELKTLASGICWPRIMGPAGRMPPVVCWGRARDVVTRWLSVFGSTVHGQSLLSETQSQGERQREVAHPSQVGWRQEVLRDPARGVEG